jgi:hypothetical protein
VPDLSAPDDNEVSGLYHFIKGRESKRGMLLRANLSKP